MNPVGYYALRFAFHPGDVTTGSSDAFLVRLNVRIRYQIELLGDELEGISIDLDHKEWQVVEIPMDAFDFSESAITSIRFTGNLEGTFYLDDIRLVAARPSSSEPTAVLEERTAALPQSFTLNQNYPNPFNSETVIRFALPTSADVELSIFNLAGQQVATLVGGTRQAGVYTVHWDCRDDGGRELASGVYLYRLTAGEQWVETRKLLLLR